MGPTTYIFAGTSEEAAEAAQKRGVTDWRYIAAPEDLPIPTDTENIISPAHGSPGPTFR
jgi:hypothetical protein